LPYTQRAQTIGICRVLRLFERHCDVRLRGQIVDFVWLDLLDDADEAGRIRHVSIVQEETLVIVMRILVDVVDTISVEAGGAALDAMNFVALLE
jgi:hypothetical protein